MTKWQRSHKKRGYYLQSALEEKGITGVIPGATKVWKFNTYGTTRKQAEHLARSFVEIARENGLAVRDNIPFYRSFFYAVEKHNG